MTRNEPSAEGALISAAAGRSATVRFAHLWSGLIITGTVLLVVWGAAVTTANVGLAVPDWPLSFGSINPDNWVQIEPLFLEHGHRLIASGVGTLTLILFLVLWFGERRPVWTAAVTALVLVAVLAAVIPLINARQYVLAALAGAGCAVWLMRGWLGGEWSLTLRLAALALLVVALQAILGGIRVTEMSDLFGVLHGCLAQIFFCILLLFWMASGRRPSSADAAAQSAPSLSPAGPIALSVLVFAQLALGAAIRHTQRVELAAYDVVTTGGQFVPLDAGGDVQLIFAHKVGALAVFAAAVAVTIAVIRRAPGDRRELRRMAASLLVLLCIQIGLGVSVLITDVSFWITNLHVLNGLLILGTAFVLAVRVIEVRRGFLADRSGGASVNRATRREPPQPSATA